MPRFSVFTPTHRPRYLDECFESLRRQSCQDWEWVVVLNGGAAWRPADPDDRIRVIVADGVSGVGALKRLACEQASGEILVELDHDDLLAPDALEEVGRAFDSEPEASLV